MVLPLLGRFRLEQGQRLAEQHGHHWARPPGATAVAACDHRRASTCCSSHLRRPAPLAVQVFCPAAAAVGEVLAMGNQALVQVAGEQGDALGPWVMPEKMAGHADLAGAVLEQHSLIEVRPLLHREIEPGELGHRPG